MVLAAAVAVFLAGTYLAGSLDTGEVNISPAWPDWSVMLALVSVVVVAALFVVGVRLRNLGGARHSIQMPSGQDLPGFVKPRRATRC